mmetsp:Transcript_8059/g.15774  ORF Transcript_8059/g.15774 Transcript_8059/m.15774 type:complete len:241 (+) Transcript_8059:31-753(+)
MDTDDYGDFRRDLDDVDDDVDEDVEYQGREAMAQAHMDDIDQGLDRIISKTDEMHRTGRETASQLYRQGEQMRSAIDELEAQDEMLDDADFTLQKLEQGCLWQLCCCCCCCCQPTPIQRRWNGRGSASSEDPFEEPLIGASIGMKKTNSRGGRVENSQPLHVIDDEGDDDSLTLEEEFDRKVDQKLDKIGGALSKLGNLAGDLTAELEYQGKVLIPELDHRVEKSNSRTTDMVKRTRKLL